MSGKPEDQPCCGEFATCQKPCVPRGTKQGTERVEGFAAKAAAVLPAEHARAFLDEFWRLMDGHPPSEAALPHDYKSEYTAYQEAIVRIAELERELAEADDVIAAYRATVEAAQNQIAEARKIGKKYEDRYFSATKDIAALKHDIERAVAENTRLVNEREAAELAEREACAMLCDETMAQWRNVGAAYFDCAKHLAAAIRARTGGKT